MKKRLLCFFVAGLVAWSSISSFALADDDEEETTAETWVGAKDDSISEDNQTSGGPFSVGLDPIEVTVSEDAVQLDKYQVKLKWTALSFTYAPVDTVWNPDTLEWEDVDPEQASMWYATGDESEAQITPKVTIQVENRSSQPVSVSFKASNKTIADNTPIVEVTGTDEEGADIEEETGLTLSVTTTTESDTLADADENAVEDEETGEKSGPTGKWNITLDGEPNEDISSLSIPLTCVIKSAE